MIGSTIMGARAAPTPQEVTGQKEFGNRLSEMPNLSLISIAALVIDVALKPTMRVLQVCVRLVVRCIQCPTGQRIGELEACRGAIPD